MAQVSRWCPAPLRGRDGLGATACTSLGSAASISWVPPECVGSGPPPHLAPPAPEGPPGSPSDPGRSWAWALGTPVPLFSDQPHQSGLCAPENPPQMVCLPVAQRWCSGACRPRSQSWAVGRPSGWPTAPAVSPRPGRPTDFCMCWTMVHSGGQTRLQDSCHSG